MPDPARDSPLASAYARWRASTLGRITDELQQRLLLDLIGEVRAAQVLDIGCGDGALAIELAGRGASVSGIDKDGGALEAARVRADRAGVTLRLREGGAAALPFEDATFDRVIAVTVLCFVPDPDRAIGEMARVLKPGGRLVVGELGRWSLWATQRRIAGWLGNPVWRAAHFRTGAGLRDLARRQGLNVRDTRGATFYPPWGAAASVMARPDPCLGRRTTLGAAFIVVAAEKPDR